jgi:hypothetical protein
LADVVVLGREEDHVTLEDLALRAVSSKNEFSKILL